MRETKSSRVARTSDFPPAFHRIVQWGEEGLGCWEDDGGMSEFTNNLLEDLDSNGTFAENAFEILGNVVFFCLGKLYGATGSLHEETEEFLRWCPACIAFFEFFHGYRVLAAGVTGDLGCRESGMDAVEACARYAAE